MNEKEILKTLENIGAIITNSHIVYTSGRHGSAYVNKDAVYPHTEITSNLCEEMANRFKGKGIEVVAGPTIGGVILSQWVANHLSKIEGREIQGVFAEEDENKDRFFKRGYDKIIKGKKVLIVEDILTTGGSVKKVVDALNNLDADIIGCAVLCNRGNVTNKDLNIPTLDSLVNIQLDSWDEAECPLCKNETPINVNVGKGRDFIAKQAI